MSSALPHLDGGGEALLSNADPTTHTRASQLPPSLRADAGIVISASHNPFADNGIKFFSSAGAKLGDDVEAEIEARLAAGTSR